MKNRSISVASEKRYVVVIDPGEEAFATLTRFANEEGLSGVGDLALGDDGKASLHIHVVLGLSDGSTRGGHFLSGIVRSGAGGGPGIPAPPEAAGPGDRPSRPRSGRVAVAPLSWVNPSRDRRG